jgi:ferredoxin-NADP reductase
VTDAAPTAWQDATVVSIREETPRAVTIRLRLAHPAVHRPGQHYLLRLTAPDGYTATRSYSVASAPDHSGEIELTVERLADGEVSTFLHDVLDTGDVLEVRGPTGGWFVWDGTAPAVLIGGGSGVVPLMSMLRHARRLGRSDLVRLVASVRAPEDLLYPDELVGPEVTVVFTRRTPSGSSRSPGRLASADLPPLRAGTIAYVCGSPGFTGSAADLLTAAGLPPSRIRVELFGASG